MADYVLIRKSRNIISSVLHVVFNVALGVGSILITQITGSWVIGMVLVILSKWRIFAVRPRFWALNLKSNLVDLIVGASFVLLAYAAGTEWLPVHLLLSVCYTLWLVVLKPRSSELAAETQALVAVLLGTTTATELFASDDSIYLTISCFVIGYAAMRHILVQSDDDDFPIITLAAGLISAEIAWLSHSWLIIYDPLRGFDILESGIIISQLAIVLSVMIFVVSRVYRSIIKHDGKLKWEEISAPLIFSALVILMVVVLFSQPRFNV